MRKDLRLGGIVGAYICYKNNANQIGEDIKRVVVDEIYTTLQEFEN